MDKRTKKRLDALRAKLQKLEQQVAGAKRQPDDADETARLEREVAATKEQMLRVIGG